MKKRTNVLITIFIVMSCFFMLSSCGNNDPVLSGRYVGVYDSSQFLIFEGNTVTLHEGDTEIRSGTYRFHNDTLILNWDGFAEAFTLDDNHMTLFHGNSNHDNFDEIAFIKEN